MGRRVSRVLAPPSLALLRSGLRGGPAGLAEQLAWAAAWLRSDTIPSVLEFRDGRVVLPAFSHWAGGCVLGRQPLLGEWARAAGFEKAIACLGPRLLPIPWNRLPRGVYSAIS